MTNRQRALGVLDAIVYAYVFALIHLALFGGFTVQFGFFRLSAHGYAQLILPLAGLLLLTWWHAGAPFSGWRRFLTAPFRRWRFRRRAAAPLLLAAIAAGAIVMALRPPSGLVGRYFANPRWEGTPVAVAVDSAPTLEQVAHWFETDYSVEWTGVIEIRQDGPHRFFLDSDDGSALWIDGSLVVDNLGSHSLRRIEGTRQLTRGFHALRLRYMQEGGRAQLLATWAAPDGHEQPLGPASLFPTAPDSFSLAVSRVANALELIVKILVLAALAAALLAAADVAFAGGRMAAAAAIDVALIAALIVSLWTAGLGWFPGLRAWLPGALALIFIVLRRIARGTFTGPLVLVRHARGVLHATRVAISQRRAAFVALTIATTSAVVLVGVVTESQRGLVGRYYSNPDWTGEVIIEARDRTPGRQRFAYDFVDPDNLTSVDWRGAISVPTTGEYQFALTAGGDSALWIDDILIVDGRGARGTTRTTAVTRLASGLHAIRIRYADDRDRGTPWRVEWSHGVDAPTQPLSAALWVAAPDRTRLTYFWYRFSTSVLAIASALWLAGLTLAWLMVWNSLLENPRVVERYSSHLVLMMALAACYALTAWLGLRQLWGFAAFGLEAVRVPPIFLLLLLLPVLMSRRRPTAVESALGRARAYVAARPLALAAAAATCATLVFFWFRNGHVNSDGVMYRWLAPEIVTGESPVGFDEMWEGFLHAWFWHFMHGAFGWSVRLSYQVLSSAAGGVFLAVLWLYGRRLVPQRPLVFCVLMLAGGYMQLFFGEVENYTLTAVLIVGYLLASASFLQTRTPLIVPSVALAVAMTFHMLTGFLLPSLLFLYVVAIRRRTYGGVALAAIASSAVVVATMIVLGVPMRSFYQDSWAGASMRVLVGNALPINPFGEGAAQLTRHWAFFRFDQYHWDQYNLLALMFPAHLALLPLLLPGRIKWDVTNVHLALAAAGMAFFQFNYRGMLPLANDDWNLYACAALPLAAFVWRNLLNLEASPSKRTIVIGWATLSFAHSYAWILANSRYVP
ncbi:MAG TPA: PA14 domain-containing protein [Vicinamibacterales bacterium]|nr:PA14 domain-containing protein [Vicinamibacterales bacterium]